MAPRISGRGPPSPAGYIVAGLDEVADKVFDKGRGEGRFQDTPPTVAAVCDRRPLHEPRGKSGKRKAESGNDRSRPPARARPRSFVEENSFRGRGTRTRTRTIGS
jgi:hypothetical protein